MKKKQKKLRGYIFSRTFMNERVPQHVQNIVIRDYCVKNKYDYLLSSTEYIFKNSSLMLNQVLKELKNIDGVVAYSLFQLPETNDERKKILINILKKKKEFHFAVEGIKFSKNQDLEKIENLWLIKKALPNCLKKLN